MPAVDQSPTGGDRLGGSYFRLERVPNEDGNVLAPWGAGGAVPPGADSCAGGWLTAVYGHSASAHEAAQRGPQRRSSVVRRRMPGSVPAPVSGRRAKRISEATGR